MSDFNLYSVNWRDGMLLSEQHLADQERFLEELTRWYAIPTGAGYGLVRGGAGARPALDLTATVSGDKLRVEVSYCQAITPDGYVISLGPSTGRRLQVSVTAPAGEIPVYIGVKPAEKIEAGEPDPSEDVPRMPHRASNYVLCIGEPPGFPIGQQLQIARLVISGTEVSSAPNYLPPCVTLFADERLHQRTAALRNRLETLLSVGNRAYTALVGGELAGGSGSLKGDLTRTVYQFVSFLSSTLDDFVVGPNAGRPLSAVLFHKKLFRVFQTLLNLHPGIRDYLHEKYFVKEAGSDISRFVSGIDGFLMSEYNHEDIGRHIAEIEQISDQIKGVLGYLAHVQGDQLGPQAVATDSLAYSGRTFMLAPYSGTRVEQIGDLTYLEVTLSESRSMEDSVILLAKGLFGSGDWANMLVRLGLNEARGLGETDPVEVDATTYGDKVALHPHDMLQSPSVHKLTMVFRGVPDANVFSQLGAMDLFIYAL